MKKVLIALTLAVAGVASAQVGIYGRVGTYLDNTKTGTSTVQGMANDLSHFGIRATENLGGGLTARATYETYIQANSPETSTTAFIAICCDYFYVFFYFSHLGFPFRLFW